MIVIDIRKVHSGLQKSAAELAFKYLMSTLPIGVESECPFSAIAYIIYEITENMTGRYHIL